MSHWSGTWDRNRCKATMRVLYNGGWSLVRCTKKQGHEENQHRWPSPGKGRPHKKKGMVDLR